MSNFIEWRNFAGERPDKHYKATLFQGGHMMVGLNCLLPGQTQASHAHEGADKIYFVLEGRGRFTVGDDEREVGEGGLIVAPAGVPHGVTSTGEGRLSVLVAIAPFK
jgi:quercetin dioxygenase-like cupin family protein